MPAATATADRDRDMAAIKAADLRKPEEMDPLERVILAIPGHMAGAQKARAVLAMAELGGRQGWGECPLTVFNIGRLPEGLLSHFEGRAEVARKYINRLSGRWPAIAAALRSAVASRLAETYSATHWGLAMAADPEGASKALAESWDRTAPGRTYHHRDL
jgi:hypothetical protein